MKYSDKSRKPSDNNKLSVETTIVASTMIFRKATVLFIALAATTNASIIDSFFHEGREDKSMGDVDRLTRNLLKRHQQLDDSDALTSNATSGPDLENVTEKDGKCQ